MNGSRGITSIQRRRIWLVGLCGWFGLLKIFGEALQHLSARMRLLATLFIVHLSDEMHELLHRQ